MLVILISLFLISILILKFPQFTFIVAFTSQFAWLPFQVAFRSSDLGPWVIALQSVCILILVLTKTSEIAKNHKFEILIFVMLGLLSILFKNKDVNWLTYFLGIKFIIVPAVISFAYLYGKDFQKKLISSIFILQILNFAAGVFERQFGLSRLLSFGFEYGTNIRNFDSGTLRVPGLAITNFDLGLTSGVILSLAYFIQTGRLNFEQKYNQFFILIVLISSAGGIFLSYSRSGAILSATVILLGEAFERRGFLKAQTLFLTGAVVGLILMSGNFLFSDNSSFKARLSLWEDLPKLTNPLIGQGVGTTGSATKSSFTSAEIPVVVDNYIISIYLQLGLLAIIIFGAYLSYLVVKGDSFGRALVVGLIVAMQFVELWEYSLPTSLLLFLYYSFSRHDSSEFLKTRI